MLNLYSETAYSKRNYLSPWQGYQFILSLKLFWANATGVSLSNCPAETVRHALNSEMKAWPNKIGLYLEGREVKARGTIH